MRIVVIVAGALVLAAEAAYAGGHAPAAVVLDAVAGSVFLAVGVLVIGVHRREGVVALSAGAAWFLANLISGIISPHLALMAHTVLGHPDGRLRGRPARVVLTISWLAVLLPWPALRSVAAVIAGVGLAAVAGRSTHRDALPWRPTGAAWTLGAAIAGPSLLRLAMPVTDAADAVALAHAGLVTLAGVSLVRANLRARTGELADTVVELTDLRAEELDVVRDHRDGVAVDPALQAVVVTVTGLLDDNRVLREALEAQVEEVRRSRLRLLEAADVERGRLARRLSQGTAAQLDELDCALLDLASCATPPARAAVRRLQHEVSETREDLQRLAHGLHPRRLVEGGLRLALEDLGSRAVLPTQVTSPEERFPTLVETTVWYVCAEAAANVAKHARATRMTIEVVSEGTTLVATVSDDGVGGAQPLPSHGLAGLTDRLDAVGGRLELCGLDGGGTRLRAWVPLP